MKRHGSRRRSHVFCWALASLLLAAARPAAAPAQEGPAATFGESLAVELVMIEVVARGPGGELVTDLDRSELVVEEDGVPVAIASFEPPRAALASSRDEAAMALAGASSSAPSVADGGRLVVFVDDAHLSAAWRDAFLRDLWQHLSVEVDAATEVAVVSYGHGLLFHSPFTADRAQIAAGLEAALQQPALGVQRGMDRRAAIQTVHQRQRFAVEGIEGPCPPDLGTLASSLADQERDLALRSVAGLRYLVATLGGIGGGVKNVLYVGSGLPLVPGQAIIDFTVSLCDGTGVRDGIELAADARAAGLDTLDPRALQMELFRLSIADELREVTRLATANGVRIFSFQASPPPSLSNEAADGAGKLRTSAGRSAEEHNDEGTLYALAEQTGGEAYLAGTRVSQDLAAMSRVLRSSYRIGYTAPSGRDGGRHEITIRSTRPGVQITHPRFRKSKSVEEEIGERLLAALHHGEERRPPGAELRVVGDGDPDRVRLELPLPAFTLPDGAGGQTGMVNLVVTARGPDGRSVGLRKKWHPIRVSPGDPSQRFTIEVEMGRNLAGHRIAVALHDELQGTVWTMLGSG